MTLYVYMYGFSTNQLEAEGSSDSTESSDSTCTGTADVSCQYAIASTRSLFIARWGHGTWRVEHRMPSGEQVIERLLEISFVYYQVLETNNHLLCMSGTIWMRLSSTG